MDLLTHGASLADLQDYVAKMEVERGLDHLAVDSQCLKLGEEVGELFRAVRKANGDPADPHGRVVDIGEERANVLILVASIANRKGIDLEAAFRAKEAKNNYRTWI
ncbi:hypothetical protein NE236_23600 [Actinoallomurus purpureus]|uniref:MazG nucleotide pyrophosphohydrolase domain-containing protein n=1 Tax=Actinoallomurus purpureus TaxID=478114 RepID=UPI0020920556|nr:MazG nucleotide pyrophosphohydrolase domain-containing protein [Actinoallomurus purpureus]MCO6007968.1 hypothetical protein [Actinoallomurus purpureus]